MGDHGGRGGWVHSYEFSVGSDVVSDEEVE